MNDKQFRTLLAAVQCGSLSKAEETLFLSKQAIKKQIDSLEEELGFPLIVRNRQGIVATPAGEEFCRWCTKTLVDLESVTNRCRGLSDKQDIIRIENPPHPRLLLERVFAEFNRQYPHIRLQTFLQKSSSYIVDDILNDRADIAEGVYYPELENSGIAYTKLRQLHYKCLMAPGHALAERKSIRVEELSGNRVGLLEKSVALAQEIRAHCRQVKLETFSRSDLQQIFSICYNNGIFISKAYYTESMQPLLSIPLETEIAPYAIILHQKEPAPAVSAFINVTKALYPATEDEAHTS